MKPDPIVEQVHRVREQMWDACGGTLERLIASLRASEADHRDRVLSPERLAQMRLVAPPGKRARSTNS
jgi:hypothetical protein